MDSAPLGSTLTAQRGWFFFDDIIVSLGSKITASSADPVETIVAQWPLSTPTQPLVADGVTIATGPYSQTLPKAQWLASDGFGYYFPGGSDVRAEIKDQSGDWSDLGTSAGAVSWRFLTLALEHGVAPKNAGYAYTIALRNQDLSTWAAKPPFQILQNDETIAAAQASGATGIVFWQPGSIQVAAGDGPHRAQARPCVAMRATGARPGLTRLFAT
jgi:hyaluronate lyase